MAGVFRGAWIWPWICYFGQSFNLKTKIPSWIWYIVTFVGMWFLELVLELELFEVTREVTIGQVSCDFVSHKIMLIFELIYELEPSRGHEMAPCCNRKPHDRVINIPFEDDMGRQWRWPIGHLLDNISLVLKAKDTSTELDPKLEIRCTTFTMDSAQLCLLHVDTAKVGRKIV